MTPFASIPIPPAPPAERHTMSTTTPTTSTPTPNLVQIREAYRGTLVDWVGPDVEDQDPCDREFWAQCVIDASAATDHAREAMVAAERGDLQAASDHAREACVRARPFGTDWNSALRQLYDAIRAAIEGPTPDPLPNPGPRKEPHHE